MAQQISEGFVLVTLQSFRRMQRPDLDKLSIEIEKLLRSIRADGMPTETKEIQKRNRRLQRLSSCQSMVRSYRQRKRW